MSGIITTPPTLDYVGSVDMSSDSGTTLYKISFDDICGNDVLMFEYKLQAEGSATDPSNVTLGYVNMDHATFQQGEGSIWQLAIPATNNVYEPSVAIQIQIRVYVATNSEIAVTPWSNLLDVHNPPEQPTIFYSVYNDTVDVVDDVYVVIDDNSSYDYSAISFVLACYFTDASGVSTWKVSAPTAVDGSYTTSGSKLIVFPDTGLVSATIQVVYVALYAVYSFDNAGTTYYSVSHISDTVTAVPGSVEETPTLTSILYNVYVADPSAPGPQTITATWTAPNSAVIPGFEVVSYQLFYTSTDFIEVSGNVLTYNLDMADLIGDWGCGDDAVISVRAVTASVTSGSSNVLTDSYFQYASAPTVNGPTSITYGTISGLYTISGTFSASSTSFCDDDGYYAMVNDGSPVALSGLSYELTSASPSGTIAIFKSGNNPNAANQSGQGTTTPLSGPAGSASYQYSNTVLSATYTPSTQAVDLSWVSNEIDVGTRTYMPQANYGAGWVDLSDNELPDSTTTYSVDVSAIACGTSMRFIIRATTTIGDYSYVTYTDPPEIFVSLYPPDQPTAFVNWSAANEDDTLMDISFTIQPTDIYCADASASYFDIVVKDASGSVIETATRPYTSEQLTVYLDNVTYSASGTIDISVAIPNVNDEPNFYNGPIDVEAYVTSAVPLFVDVVIDGSSTELTFQIVTSNLLGIQGAVFIAPGSLSGPSRFPTVDTEETNISVSRSEPVDNTYTYTYRIDAAYFALSSFTTPIVLCASNAVGIGYYAISP